MIGEERIASSIHTVTPVQSSTMTLKNRTTSKISSSSVAYLIETSEEAEGDVVQICLKTYWCIPHYAHYTTRKLPTVPISLN